MYQNKNSEKLSNEIFETIEKKITPKAFQHTIVSLLKNNKTFSPDFIQKITSFYQEAKVISQISLKSFSKDIKTDGAIACHRGCSFCCHLKVMVTAPEFQIISNYVENTFPKEKIKALKLTLRKTVSETTRVTGLAERLAIPCSFLENNVCSIYDARPFTCRAYYSRDSMFCQKYLKDQALDIPINMCHYTPYNAFKKGVIQALEVAGFEYPVEELNSGMQRYYDNVNV